MCGGGGEPLGLLEIWPGGKGESEIEREEIRASEALFSFFFFLAGKKECVRGAGVGVVEWSFGLGKMGRYMYQGVGDRGAVTPATRRRACKSANANANANADHQRQHVQAGRYATTLFNRIGFAQVQIDHHLKSYLWKVSTLR